MTGNLPVEFDPEKFRRDQALVEEGIWDKVRRLAGRVPLAEDAVAAYHCAVDPATPAMAKAILYGALAYFVLPVDVIPDVLAGLGFTDDIAVLTAAYTAVQSNLLPEHRAKARRALGKPAEPAAAGP